MAQICNQWSISLHCPLVSPAAVGVSRETELNQQSGLQAIINRKRIYCKRGDGGGGSGVGSRLMAPIVKANKKTHIYSCLSVCCKE